MRPLLGFSRVLAVALVLLGALVACGFFSPLAVESVTLKRADAGGNPGETVTAFKPSDRKLFAVAALNQVATNVSLRIVWTMVDTPAGKDVKLDEVTAGGIAANTFTTNFARPTNWPPGKYRIDFFQGDKLLKAQEFTVDAGPVAVESVTLKRADASGNPGETVTAFKPSDRKLFAVAALNQIVANFKGKIVWTMVDTSAGKNEKLIESPLAMTAVADELSATLTMPRDLLPGKYKVDFYQGDNLLKSKDFAIEGASPAIVAATKPGSATPVAGASVNVTGVYDVAGRNPDGSPFGATATVRQADQIYTVTWDSPKRRGRGAGILRGGEFALAWGSFDCEVNLYQARPDGNLDGLVGNVEEVKTGTETATRSTPGVGLDGNYSVKGTNIDRSDYQGALVVTRQGSVFRFTWQIEGDRYDGVGLQRGSSVVAVAPSDGKSRPDCGASLLTIGADGVLDGITTSYGMTATGSEIWKKR